MDPFFKIATNLLSQMGLYPRIVMSSHEKFSRRQRGAEPPTANPNVLEAIY
jgi:hypothetical protein